MGKTNRVRLNTQNLCLLPAHVDLCVVVIVLSRVAVVAALIIRGSVGVLCVRDGARCRVIFEYGIHEDAEKARGAKT